MNSCTWPISGKFSHDSYMAIAGYIKQKYSTTIVY